jgi:chromate transporter
VGTTWLVGRVAIGDALTIAVALLSVAALARWRKLPEPVVIAAAAIVGLIAYPLLQPQWVLR